MSGVLCSICHEEYKTTDETCSTYCGHLYHNICLTNWRGRSSSCPQCNTPNAQTHKVFLNIEDSSQAAAKKLQDLTTQLDQSVRDRSMLEARVAELQEELDRSHGEMVQLRSLLDSERQSLQQYIADNGELQTKLNEIESTQEVAQLQLQDTMSQNRDLQRQAETNEDMLIKLAEKVSEKEIDLCGAIGGEPPKEITRSAGSKPVKSDAAMEKTAAKLQSLEKKVQALTHHLEAEIDNSTKLSLENKKLQQLMAHKQPTPTPSPSEQVKACAVTKKPTQPSVQKKEPQQPNINKPKPQQAKAPINAPPSWQKAQAPNEAERSNIEERWLKVKRIMEGLSSAEPSRPPIPSLISQPPYKTIPRPIHPPAYAPQFYPYQMLPHNGPPANCHPQPLHAHNNNIMRPPMNPTKPAGKIASPTTIIIKRLPKDSLPQDSNLKNVPVKLIAKIGIPISVNEVEHAYTLAPGGRYGKKWNRNQLDHFNLVVKFKQPHIAMTFLNLRGAFAAQADTKDLSFEPFMVKDPTAT